MNKLILSLKKKNIINPFEKDKSFLKEKHILWMLYFVADFLDTEKSCELEMYFWNEKWISPVFSLPYLLDQIPNIIKSIKEEKDFYFDLSEQWREREIKFKFKDWKYIANCSYHPSYRKPDWKDETHEKEYLLDMFSTFLDNFIWISLELVPALRKNKIFVEFFKDSIK